MDEKVEIAQAMILHKECESKDIIAFVGHSCWEGDGFGGAAEH